MKKWGLPVVVILILLASTIWYFALQAIWSTSGGGNKSVTLSFYETMQLQPIESVNTAGNSNASFIFILMAFIVIIAAIIIYANRKNK